MKDEELDRLIDAYRLSIGLRCLTRRSRILKYFMRFSESCRFSIGDCTPKRLDAFIAYLYLCGMTPKQIAQEFSILRKFFDYLLSLGRIQQNSARQVFARAMKKEPRVYSDRQLVSIHRQYHPRAKKIG